MNLSSTVKTLFHDFKGLFFPQLCIACNENTPQPSVPICVTCENELPLTNFQYDKDNELAQRFWGRVPIEHAAAMYYFKNNNVVQELIHAFKYNNKPEVATLLGEWYGHELRMSPFSAVDYLIPVPLHPKKQYKRGYNQSEMIGRGMAEVLGKPLLTNALLRVEYTETQTKKTRIERFENVKSAFAVENADSLKGKHLLLIDDVVTTGATLEACAIALLNIPDTKVSIATIGIATL